MTYLLFIDFKLSFALGKSIHLSTQLTPQPMFDFGYDVLVVYELSCILI